MADIIKFPTQRLSPTPAHYINMLNRLLPPEWKNPVVDISFVLPKDPSPSNLGPGYIEIHLFFIFPVAGEKILELNVGLNVDVVDQIMEVVRLIKEWAINEEGILG